MRLELYIWMLRYTDKKLTDDTKIPGFASLFRTSPDSQKFYGFFLDVGVRNEQEWLSYFNRIRRERFDYLTEIRSNNAFYRFLKHDLEDPSEYYFCLPRGFTKSEAVVLDLDKELLRTLKGKTYRFERVRKLTESIGICRITNV